MHSFTRSAQESTRTPTLWAAASNSAKSTQTYFASWCAEKLSERTEDDRDITAEMNFLMSLEAPDSRLNFLKHPHEEGDRGIWADELYGDTDFYDDVTGKGFNHSLTARDEVHSRPVHLHKSPESRSSGKFVSSNHHKMVRRQPVR